MELAGLELSGMRLPPAASYAVGSDSAPFVNALRLHRPRRSVAFTGGTAHQPEVHPQAPSPPVAADLRRGAAPAPRDKESTIVSRMITIERFERGATPHYRPSPPTPAIRIDTS
jgi:hypothetical protein